MITNRNNFNKSLALSKRFWRKRGKSTGSSPTVTYPDVINSDFNIPISNLGHCIQTQAYLQAAVNYQDNFIISDLGSPLGNANISKDNVMTEVFNG